MDKLGFLCFFFLTKKAIIPLLIEELEIRKNFPRNTKRFLKQAEIQNRKNKVKELKN